MAELARVHLIVELVLGGAQVTQIRGYLRPFGDEGVLLLAATALYYKFTPLQEQVEIGGFLKFKRYLNFIHKPQSNYKTSSFHSHSRKWLRSPSSRKSDWWICSHL